ncbi:hypothetical protein Dimus_039529 [Dionaea muscipula]
MLIAAKDMLEVDKLKYALNGEFEMKDLGATKKILGVKIRRDRKAGKVFLTHKGFVEKVLDRFDMLDAKPVSTPMDSHFRLSVALSRQSDDDKNYMSRVPYANVVGSMMYVMVCTRPDIAQSVSVVSRYMPIPARFIGKQLSGFLDIYGVHLFLVWILARQKMVL